MAYLLENQPGKRDDGGAAMRCLLLILALASRVALGQADFEWVATAGPRAAAPAAGSSLTNGLVAYWPMDLTNSASSDLWGTNYLSPRNGITCTAGVVSNALLCISNSLTYAQAAAAPQISISNRSWTVNFWFNRATSNVFQYVCGKMGGSPNYEWRTTVQTKFTVNYSTNGTGLASLNSISSPLTDVWYMATIRFDVATRALSLGLNAGEWVTNVVAGINPANGSGLLQFGRNPANSVYFDGQIDEAAMWADRVLSDREAEHVYTNGLAGVRLLDMQEPQ